MCGALETVTEGHELAFSDWIAVSDTEHQREKSCLCGFFDYETAPHHDDDGDCFCEDCGYQIIRRFSVTVPAYLPIAVSETGTVTTAENAQIINHSAGKDFEADEINPSGLFVSVEGLPADVDREAVESIIAAAVELLNAEVRETLANRKDEAHERI